MPLPAHIVSGRYAYVNGLSCTQSWQFNQTVAQQRYAASCVPDATNVPEGPTDWTGQATGLGGQPAIFPDGDDFTFLGVIDGKIGQLLSLNGDVLCESLTIDINKEDGSSIKWTATLGAQGDMAEAATAATDSVVSGGQSGVDLDVKIDDVSVSGVRSAQMVFRRPVTTALDAGLTYRSAGNFEADINFAVYNKSQEVAAYAPNALEIVKIYITPTTFWEFKKIRFGSKSGFVVDRASNNVLGYTVNGMFNGAEDDDLGHIIGPDLTQYFPTAGGS
jgi:hypothetical protein